MVLSFSPVNHTTPQTFSLCGKKMSDFLEGTYLTRCCSPCWVTHKDTGQPHRPTCTAILSLPESYSTIKLKISLLFCSSLQFPVPPKCVPVAWSPFWSPPPLGTMGRTILSQGLNVVLTSITFSLRLF